jgi:hypothetical protein
MITPQNNNTFELQRAPSKVLSKYGTVASGIKADTNCEVLACMVPHVNTPIVEQVALNKDALGQYINHQGQYYGLWRELIECNEDSDIQFILEEETAESLKHFDDNAKLHRQGAQKMLPILEQSVDDPDALADKLHGIFTTQRQSIGMLFQVSAPKMLRAYCLLHDRNPKFVPGRDTNEGTVLPNARAALNTFFRMSPPTIEAAQKLLDDWISNLVDDFKHRHSIIEFGIADDGLNVISLGSAHFIDPTVTNPLFTQGGVDIEASLQGTSYKTFHSKHGRGGTNMFENLNKVTVDHTLTAEQLVDIAKQIQAYPKQS